MSFKRDGDDKSALSNQRKRRVAELLHEDINDEELSRLSNGRYICKLCTHGPIFDTLDMFYVHKQGKKHQHSIQYAEQQKQELWDLIQKRKHEEALAARGVVAQLPVHDQGDKVSETGLKKQRRKPYDRKTILDVSPIHSSASISPCNNTDTSSCSHLPGNRHSTIIAKSSQNKSGFHSNSSLQRSSNTYDLTSCSQHSNSSQSDAAQSNAAKHNTDKFKWKGTAKPTNKDSVINIKDVQKMVGLSNSEQRNKFYLARKNNFSNTCNDDRMESDNKNSSAEGSSDIVSPYQVWDYYKNYKPRNLATIKQANQTESVQENSSYPVSETKHDVCNSSNIQVSQVKKERAEKILHAFGSGWKKDWDGKWIKDEDAEFDSDEEAPDII